MIQYFGRILGTPSNRLLYKVYKWDYGLNESMDIKTWSSEVKCILQEHGMEQIFIRQDLFPVKRTVEELQQSMHQRQLARIQEECHSKPKLRTFVIFKDFSSLAPHIAKPLRFEERRILSKLRLGTLPLRIESARYARPIIPETERVCYCNSGDIETEYHVLFQCHKYALLRQNWLDKLCIPHNFLDLSQREKFNHVLNNPSNVRPTAKYLLSLMDIRSLANISN